MNRDTTTNLLVLVLMILVINACALSGSENEWTTPREHLCAIEGWAAEAHRFKQFALEGVAFSADKDLGLVESTAYSNENGRVLLWDAKCGSRPFTVTARDDLGRELTMSATQPADLGGSLSGLPPRFRRFALGGTFTFPLSERTVMAHTVEIVGFQQSDSGGRLDLVRFPASLGREVTLVVQYELFPDNGHLTINGMRVHPRFFGEPPSHGNARGAHEYRYIPTHRGKHDVRLVSYYGSIGRRNEFSFRVE